MVIKNKNSGFIEFKKFGNFEQSTIKTMVSDAQNINLEEQTENNFKMENNKDEKENIST